jgi:membrane-associated phospholipid phosphatase
LRSGRFLGYLRDWIPFVALFLGYEAMRGIAPKTGIVAHEAGMADVERALFNGQIPSHLLQSTLGAPQWLTIACTVVYFCHFVFPVAVGMVLWLVDRVQFLRFVTALIGMSFGAFIVFIVLPTAPPWMANEDGVLPGVTKLISSALPSGVSPYYHSLNPNQVAAFPSLHAAYPLLGALALWTVSRRASVAALGWCVLVWFGVVYLGEHYLIDVYGGIVFAALSWLVMMKVVVPRVPALQRAPRANAGGGDGDSLDAKRRAGPGRPDAGERAVA